jgi:hypothetical protein
MAKFTKIKEMERQNESENERRGEYWGRKYNLRCTTSVGVETSRGGAIGQGQNGRVFLLFFRRTWYAGGRSRLFKCFSMLLVSIRTV